jgi:hypothetical protein
MRSEMSVRCCGRQGSAVALDVEGVLCTLYLGEDLISTLPDEVVLLSELYGR